MRIERIRVSGLARGLAPVLALAATAGLAHAEALTTFAGLPRVFPVQSGLVPMVVAAAFILPAAIAGVFSLLRRVGRLVGPVMGLGLATAVAAAYAAYADPNLLVALRV